LVSYANCRVAGFFIACLSALASISTETSTKEGEFWKSQAYLYTWGIIFATIAYPLAPSGGHFNTSTENSETFKITTATLGLVVIIAGTGLVVALVLRARDNILKVIGTAASLVTIAASQFLLLPELTASTFTPWKVGGGGIVVVSTWYYNYYSQEPWFSRALGLRPLFPGEVKEEAAFTAGAKEEDAGEDCAEHIGNIGQMGDSSHSQPLTPTATKIVACAIIIAFATMEVSWRTG